MKHFIVLLSLLFLTACMGMGETSPEKKPVIPKDKILGTLTLEQIEVKHAMELYITQLKSLNADNIIKMTYPRLFVPINQERFKNYLNSILTSCDLGIRSFDANITHIDKINSFSNGKFTKVNYQSTITLHLLNPNLYDTEYKMLVLHKILTQKYGEKKIHVNTKNRTVTIVKDEKILAIQDNNSDWKFLGDNAEYRRLYPKILPVEILNKI